MASLLDTPRPRHRGICRERRNRPARRRSAGYALVLVVLLLFGLMGLAALVIDIGFARLAQLQMQAAADTAALEGLRFRDELPARLQPGSKWFDEVDRAIQEAGGQPAPESDYDPQQEEWQRWTDPARRWWVGDIVRQVFRDDVDPDTGHQIHYGAGPRIEFEGGFGPEELVAGQTVNLETRGVWEPSLQLNLPNHHYGDVVAGRYEPPQPVVPGEFPGREDENYEVIGFRPEPENTPPQQLGEAPALLVRLRRTNDFLGWDDDDRISSHGRPLPFMFARGALIGKVPDAEYSPREHGITVRALAIAEARPVLSVGTPNAFATGLAHFALALHDWNKGELHDAPLRLEDGEIVRQTDLRPVGRFFLSSSTDDIAVVIDCFFASDEVNELPVVIGRRIPDAKEPDEGHYAGYVPIYAPIPEGTGPLRVVGFVAAKAVVATDRTVTITPHAGTIAAENASAIVCYKLEVTGDDLTAVLDANRSLPESLLAPVSVR